MRHQFKLYSAALAIAVSLFGVAAYADEDVDTVEESSTSAQGQGQGQGQQTIRSDGQIAQILSASNQGEIAQARVAQQRARSREVKEFARHMIASHTDLQRRQSALYRSLRIKTEQSGLGNLMGAHCSAVANFLRRQPAQKFDRVFMNMQVLTHLFTLQVLDNQLIPNATDKTLRAELQQTRREIANHLAQARAIRASLGKGQTTTSKPSAPAQRGR
jgi:predicted outer membrane protein